jgi:AcrR family transcriptional regulator
VAPTTLYRLFASKDDLVAAYVERAGEHYKRWFLDATGDGTPPARIRSLFDALIQQVQPEHCRGCPFLMALAELPDASVQALGVDGPARQARALVETLLTADR